MIRGKIIKITSRIRKDRLKQQRAQESKFRELELEHKRTQNENEYGEVSGYLTNEAKSVVFTAKTLP